MGGGVKFCILFREWGRDNPPTPLPLNKSHHQVIWGTLVSPQHILYFLRFLTFLQVDMVYVVMEQTTQPLLLSLREATQKKNTWRKKKMTTQSHTPRK